MASDRLTELALEQHEKVFPKLLLQKNKAVTLTKEASESTSGKPHLLTRKESMKSLASGTHDSCHHLERQNSKSSLDVLHPRPGLSIFRVIQATRTWKRLSQRKQYILEKPETSLENTYRLGPDPDKIFRPEKCEHSIQEIMRLFLGNLRYTPENCKRICLNISSEIKSSVEKMCFPRYKIVSHVILMQNRKQGSAISSRCLWTHVTDSFVSCTYKTEHFICVANVYAVYCE